jgi:hypothetical protein
MARYGAETSFAVDRQRPRERKRPAEGQSHQVHPNRTLGRNTVDIVVGHPLYGAHVAQLHSQVLVETISKERDARGRMRDTDGLDPEPRLQLARRKRVVDVADTHVEVGVREDVRELTPVVFGRTPGALEQEEGEDRDRQSRSHPARGPPWFVFMDGRAYHVCCASRRAPSQDRAAKFVLGNQRWRRCPDALE